MLRGEGSYYTPISVDGQVVEKRVESIEVSHEPPGATVAVHYTLTNPYDHPVSVPIQSGLTMLYQFSFGEDGQRDPELHVVPATVSHSNGEILYSADEPIDIFGATAIQRQHLGTGIPNYRHPVAVNVTLVPGDSVTIEAMARVPDRVERMILVDVMAGPDRPYGIYPQLIEHPSSRNRVPPALRIYEGASFSNDPPSVHMPPPSHYEPDRTDRLPQWIAPERFARFQAVLRQTGRLWSCAVGTGSIVLLLSMILRSLIAGTTEYLVIDTVRVALAGILTIGLAHGSRVARFAMALLLAASGMWGLLRVGIPVATGALQVDAILTEAAMIPILFLTGAGILLGSPSIRAFTARRSRGRLWQSGT